VKVIVFQKFRSIPRSIMRIGFRYQEIFN